MPVIYLVGFMGCGKSTTGRELAALLGYPFLDVDALIEDRFSCQVREIFERFGEQRFRDAEQSTLELVAEHSDAVVAAGGGAFCSERNRALLTKNGAISVFLDLPWSTLMARVAGSHEDRPLLKSEDETRRLFEARLEHYRKATLTLQVDGEESPAQVARRIVSLLPEVACVS
jgi:shikimate kinase